MPGRLLVRGGILAPSTVTEPERLDPALPPLAKEEAAPAEAPSVGDRPHVPTQSIDPFEEELPFSD
jgi:hypothetical protein